MTTMRSHVVALHQRSASHHVAKARHHKTMSAHFSELAACFQKMDGHEDMASCYQKIAEAHVQSADEHADLAGYHLDAGKSLLATAKAAGMADDDDFEKRTIIPDRVSSVITKFPTAIPRAGQPQNLVDDSAIDPALRKLVEVEDGI